MAKWLVFDVEFSPGIRTLVDQKDKSSEDIVMDSQLKESLCLMPALVLLAIAEIRRGWGVLRRGEHNLPLNEKMYIELARLLKGDEFADQAYKNTLNKPDVMAYYARMSVIGGVAVLVFCFIWVIAIMRSTP